MKLQPTEVHWDNKTLNYDLEKYNWPAWALSVVQEVAPQVTELETLHECLTMPELVKVQQHVQNACSRIDFMQKFDEFAAEVVPNRIENKRYLVQRQGTMRVVVPNQDSQNRRLQFHQGIFVGNGRGCRTIWSPYTIARDTNTMWMLDLDISREITKKFIDEKWSLEKFEDECLKHAWPINLSPGQSHLFFQEHLHGNVNNEEGYTRVSLDIRILIEGEEFGRRFPGGFFRLPGDYDVAELMDCTGKTFVTYVGWESTFSNGIPYPMQRATMDDYCRKNKISCSDHLFENEYTHWQPSLDHIIRKRPDGIVLCSIHSLPNDTERQRELLNLALDLGVELHFANESTHLRSKNDLDKIMTYINFAVRKSHPYVWEV